MYETKKITTQCFLSSGAPTQTKISAFFSSFSLSLSLVRLSRYMSHLLNFSLFPICMSEKTKIKI